ncbi:MAG: hypothetical protein C0434_02600 [Xanthomonadaceae bacterium]|nr:hypothetical protein [Xanthomonadaceae bacterium]
MHLSELVSLPLAERLEAMEAVWASPDRTAANQAVPAWHESLVLQRLEAVRDGSDTVTEIAESFARIGERIASAERKPPAQE